MKNRFGYVGSYIKACREEQGISQQKIGKSLKLSSAQSVSNWERGLAQPTDDHWPTLFKILKMDYFKLRKAFMADSRVAIEARLKPVSK